MKSGNKVFFGVLAVLVMSASVLLAQHDHGASQGGSSHMTTMQECQKHQSEMTALVDRMSKTLADAKELSNPEDMRAAMENAQSQLAEMKQHISMCPMANGMMHDSRGHMQHSKCTSDRHHPKDMDHTQE
jgi:hypothetical protein